MREIRVFGMWKKMLLGLVLLAMGASACRKTGAPNTRTPPVKSQGLATPQKAPAKRNVVLFLGDSLTAGLGVARSEAYPARIGAMWQTRGVPFRVRNAGVSGDTTAGVLRRVDWVVQKDVHTVFLCIGGNDGLRGLPIAQMRKNIGAIVEKIRKKGVQVILAGMQIPPNYGAQYTRQFAETFPQVAKQYSLTYMPFLLVEVAGKKALNAPDGIHPNAKGHRLIAKNVLAFFEKKNLFDVNTKVGTAP